MPVSSNENLNPKATVDISVTDREGNTLIAAGSPVELEIRRQKLRGIGREGVLDIAAISTISVDGQRIILSGSEHIEGKDRKGTVWALTGVGCFIVPPLNFLFLLIKGKAAKTEPNFRFSSVSVGSSYHIRI